MAKKKEEPKVNAPSGALPTPRLRGKYKDEVLPKLQEQFKYKSVMQVPKLDKIVINMGTGSTDKDSKHIENSIRDLALISGQKPITTHAKKAISNFKLREGMKVGCKVTLRGDQMYHFFDRLATVVLPRIRDFQGLSAKSFDGRGNYAIGLKEQLVLPNPRNGHRILHDCQDRRRSPRVPEGDGTSDSREVSAKLEKL